MQELIPIRENNGKSAVSAKDLHSFVDSETRFDIWIKRMLEYGFTESIDFQCLIKNVQMPNGGFKPVLDDYALTLDCAKEISMLQRNERGRKARQYFIEVEKKYRENAAQLPQTYADALRQLAEQVEESERQKQIIEEQKPKALFADAVAASNRSCLVGELSKILRQNGVEIGQQRLFKWLRKNGYLCQGGERYNLPTQKSMDLGLFEIKKTVIDKPDGTILVTTTPKITGKGQIYFVNKFLKTEAA